MSWPLVSLKDCCTVVGGATPKRNVPDFWSTEDVPWVTPKDVSNLETPELPDAPEYISRAGYESCATYMLPQGTVLLTSRAPIGNVAIAGRSMCTNQGFKSLVPGEDVDSIYLYYCIRHLAPNLEALGNGATFKEVSKKVVENFKIPLPPLEEQKRIAAVLDKADALRRKRQQAIQLTDTLLKSVFLDMFGDPVTNPKGWEVCKLEDVAEIRSGITKGRKTKDKELVETPYMRVANVQDGFLNLDNIATIPATKSEVLKYLLKTEDILLTEGGDPDKLGRGAVWNDDIPDCIHQNHIFCVRLKEEAGFKAEYVRAVIGSPYGKRYFLRAAKQTTGIASINKSQLRNFPLLVTPIDIQMRFQEVIQKHKEDLDCQQGHLRKLDSLFASLSQRAFRGELTAKDEAA
ncbi:restriction endonuclease subunit S [Coralliovum pocilloporae]|uniref:restriction endonuclease subunit S n=1 Tax=Coralliovum pocilloporae TaxID=3066369 RepID=UPI003307C15E